jgi:hypothetical protein
LLLCLTAAAALVLLVAACTGPKDDRSTGTTVAPTLPGDPGPGPGAAGSPDPAAPATLPVPAGFVAADTRGVVIPPVLPKNPKVEGEDHGEPTLPVTGGTAVIHGTVWGPEGGVEGATVRFERFVGEEWGFFEVGTGKDGKYHADELLGGRYRVRAWQKPALATTESQTLFLKADHGDASIDVGVEKFEETNLQGALAIADPHVGQEAFFQALLTRDEVGDDGIVRGVGIPAAAVQLSVLGGWKIVGQDVQTTAEDGFATFIIQCTQVGLHSVIIGSGEHALALGLPDCLPGELKPDADPTPSSTQPGAPATTVKPTSTTRPVTTTTRFRR